MATNDIDRIIEQFKRDTLDSADDTPLNDRRDMVKDTLAWAMAIKVAVQSRVKGLDINFSMGNDIADRQFRIGTEPNRVTIDIPPAFVMASQKEKTKVGFKIIEGLLERYDN